MTKLGIELSEQEQKHVLAAYVHRYTGDHKPRWVNGGRFYPLQFRDDHDWLCNTTFKVTKSGRLDMRARFCESSPTWPNGKP